MLVETGKRGSAMSGMILVGVDGASAGRAAISWAVRRAASLDSRIVLVHVVDDEWGMIGEGLRPRTQRRPTRPGRAAVERRLDEKRQVSARKRARRAPGDDA